MSQNRIWLEQPAKTWDLGVPVGNGRLGGMLLGKIEEESLVINEETLWYGPPRNRKNPDMAKEWTQIRRLLLEGRLSEASFQAKMAMTGTPKYNHPYQPAAELKLFFREHQGGCREYCRGLDLEEAIAFVSYERAGCHYRRELLASTTYQVLAMRITSEQPNLTACVNLNRKPFEEYSGIRAAKTTALWGQNGAGGIHYLTAVRMEADTPVKEKGDFVYTEGAREIVLYVGCKTSFPDCKDTGLWEEVKACLEQAAEAGYEKIREQHCKDYQRLFHRMRLIIEQDGEELVSSLSTKEQLAGLREGKRTGLAGLLVQMMDYARYLMISSSYQCQLPANLQGIWNGSFVPPWQSEFTININTEMNYWFVEKANLSECHLPLFSLLERIAENGRRTARELYGCEGFCAHHNTNLWACTEPEGIFAASPFWNMGGAWLCLHLYEHFQYTGDLEFLKQKAMPLMREAIRFLEGYLYEDEQGRLLTGPSLSPENTYRLPNGESAALCISPTMDNMIIRELVKDYLEACRLTGSEEETAPLLRILKGIPETMISRDGRICEWYQEYEELEPGHRHISHLFGLHPGTQITRETSKLYEAARRTLDYRLSHGGGHTGWSKAWVTCFYARLHEGSEVEKNAEELLQRSVQDNLLDVHPPFQIDGNFGLAEAVLESLIQSHAGYVELLPARMPCMETGRLSGVRLRGAITANLEWRKGIVTVCELLADRDCELELCWQEQRERLQLKAQTRYRWMPKETQAQRGLPERKQ